MKILICLIALALPLMAEPPALPPHLLERCSQNDRFETIKKLGGLPASEQAVIDALRFLKNTQQKDGSWTRDGKVSSTALALLCFLGHGESAGSEEFGESTLKAISFLLDRSLKNKGYICDDLKDKRWPYEHAVAVQALAEARLLCRGLFQENIPNLKRVVEVSGQIIINNQHHGGGWEYHYDQKGQRGGDSSITGWQLTALKSCQRARINLVNLKKASQKGLDFLERMQNPSGALGYSSPRGVRGNGTTLTALGACCFQDWKSTEDRRAKKATRFITKEIKFAWDQPQSDLYAHLFAAQAIKANGGKSWKTYHDMVFPEILKNQAPDGSFLITNKGDPKTSHSYFGHDAEDTPFGKHYRTCLATLTLETYYRTPNPKEQ